MAGYTTLVYYKWRSDRDRKYRLESNYQEYSFVQVHENDGSTREWKIEHVGSDVVQFVHDNEKDRRTYHISQLVWIDRGGNTSRILPEHSSSKKAKKPKKK